MSCNNCNKGITGRFICVHGGALLQDTDDPESAGMSNRMDEFLTITTHDDNMDLYKVVDVVPYNSNGIGQFEFYFCSKKCLKIFFDKILDQVTDIED